MKKIMQFSLSEGDEVWLFADLFASLLMTFMLLINVNTLKTDPTIATGSGENKTKTHLVYLVDKQHIKLGSSNQPILIAQAIEQLKISKERAELVVNARINAVELFKIFQSFE